MTGRERLTGRWALLARPVFTGPVAMLAINDAVFKPQWPGWWTGKLSDVAGVALVTVLIAVAIGNPAHGGALAVGGFTALKVVPGVAETAAPLLGGVTRRDPTDLVALLAVPPMMRALGPRLDRIRGASRAGSGWRRPSGGLPRAALAVSGATVAVLAVSATSCLDTPAVTRLVTRDGVIWAEGIELVDYRDNTSGSTSTTRPQPPTTTQPENGPDPEPTDWARSDDGGQTWEASDPPPGGPEASRSDATTACANAAGCYRIADGRTVQHRAATGEPWVTSFAYTSEQRRRLDARHDPCSGRSTRITLTGLVIAPRPDGDHVLVAAGPQGVLHRNSDGTWERHAVLEATPAPLHGPSQIQYLHGAPLLLVAAAVVLLIVGLRDRRPLRAVLAFAITLAAAFGIGMVLSVLEYGAVDYTVTGPVVAALSLTVLALSLITFRRRRDDDPRMVASPPPSPEPDTTDQPM